jgi:phospholipase/carboxylesterase
MSLDLYQHLYQPATAPDLPTILALHGTGGNERDLLGLVHAIAPGCGVLSLRGNVSERGMPRFFGASPKGCLTSKTSKYAPVKSPPLWSRRQPLRIRRQQHLCLGYSNGANIAIATLLLHPHSMRGAILFRAMATLCATHASQLGW